MSALRAPATTLPGRYERPRPAPRRSLTALPGGRREGSRFDVVRAPLQASSAAPFIIMCAAVLVTALVAVLLLNTSMAHGSYQAAALSNQVRQLQQDVQGKQDTLRQVQASLPTKAAALGMVPAANPSLLDVTQQAAAVIAAAEAQRQAAAQDASAGDDAVPNEELPGTGEQVAQ